MRAGMILLAVWAMIEAAAASRLAAELEQARAEADVHEARVRLCQARQTEIIQECSELYRGCRFDIGEAEWTDGR